MKGLGVVKLSDTCQFGRDSHQLETKDCVGGMDISNVMQVTLSTVEVVVYISIMMHVTNF